MRKGCRLFASQTVVEPFQWTPGGCQLACLLYFYGEGGGRGGGISSGGILALERHPSLGRDGAANEAERSVVSVTREEQTDLI